VAIKAVIFDIGGVLAADVWEHLLLDDDGVAARYHLDKERIREIGEDLWKQFIHRPATDQENWERVEKEYWGAFIENSRLQVTVSDLIQLSDTFIRPVPGMAELLERLRSAGIDLAICSNNTEFWFRRQMDKLGLQRFFRPERVVLSCRLGVSKSSPRHEMFQSAVDALQIGKEACIFVDDREENIRCALEFGLAGIVFPSHSESGAACVEAVLDKMGVFTSIKESVLSHRGEQSMDPVNVLFKEYDTLRQEAITTITVRNAILGFGVPTVATLFVATAHILRGTQDRYTFLSSILLMVVVPLVAFGILALWWGEYVRMQRAGRFLARLEKRINVEVHRVSGKPGKPRRLLRWERSLKHMRLPYLAGIALLLLISASSIAAGMLAFDSSSWPGNGTKPVVVEILPWLGYIALGIHPILVVVLFIWMGEAQDRGARPNPIGSVTKTGA